jgi:hypothetical protein
VEKSQTAPRDAIAVCAQPLAAPQSRRSPKGERGIFKSGPGQLGAILYRGLGRAACLPVPGFFPGGAPGASQMGS